MSAGYHTRSFCVTGVLFIKKIVGVKISDEVSGRICFNLDLGNSCVNFMVLRYAERDHEQLVALCRQRAKMGQKLTRVDPKLTKMNNHGQMEKRPVEKSMQIFVEIPTSPKRTVVLMVGPRTTVREVKEMMEAKEGGIPVARQLLRTRPLDTCRGGKFLCNEGWSLEEYGIGKESTLVCSATHNNALQ